jgi:hypothetical protein
VRDLFDGGERVIGFGQDPPALVKEHPARVGQFDASRRALEQGGAPPLWLITLDDGGRPAHATVVTDTGEMYRNVSPATFAPIDCEFGAGTLLRAAPLAAHTTRPVHTAADRETRYRNAVSYEVFVDAATWSRAYALCRRFLVPKAPRD